MERKGLIKVLLRLAPSIVLLVCCTFCIVVFAAEVPSQSSPSAASSSPPQTPPSAAPPAAGTQPPPASDSSKPTPPPASDGASATPPPPASDGASATPPAAGAATATAQQPTTPGSPPSSAVGTAGNVPVSSSPEVKKPISGVESGEPQQPVYEYQATSRPDPYKPFIAPKTVNPSELLEEDKELTGMQLFEPAQLSLVGVMDTPKGRVAMVEDATKKGYTITEGQLIGKRGKVTEIQKDQVLVTETAQTRGGEEIKTVVSMKMKRDGDGK